MMPVRTHLAVVVLATALGAGVATGGTGCTDEIQTGELRIAYLLQDAGGGALSCEAAGVATVRLRLYTSREDAAPAFEVSTPCSSDESGEGQASGAHPVGFFDSARVALLDPSGEVATMANGAPAHWEYLTVELTGGGVTNLLPEVLAIFDATGLN